jgi:6-phosphogluconolactonase
MKNRKVIVFPSVKAISEYAAERLSEITVSSGDDSHYSVALTGGDTPREIYKMVSTYKLPEIDWAGVSFYWGDERCVPPDDDQSNFKMASLNLLGNINVSQDKVFRINGEADPEMEAIRYSNILAANIPPLGGWPRFDLVLLGLGEDGHVASIFPGNEELFHSGKYCEAVVHPETGQYRVTLTGPVINNAKNIVFLVTGQHKARIVSEILQGGKTSLPASYVNPADGNLIWLLDTSAAKELSADSGLQIDYR